MSRFLLDSSHYSATPPDFFSLALITTHQTTFDRVLVREKESKVLELIQQGLSYRKVAESLGLSKNTVMRIVRDSREPLPNHK